MRCEFYAPAGYEAEEEYEDEIVDRIIEDERGLFREQWYEYIRDYE